MKSATLALFLVPTALMAQQASPSETHSHGTGRLSIAVSDAAFTLVLKVPGMDVVGFEQPAESEDDRTRVATAISDLSKPLELFVPPAEAGCATVSANVALVGDAFLSQDDSNGQGQTEFHAEYLVQCEDISAANLLDFAYFDRFEKARKLQVQLTSGENEKEFEVERETPVLRIPASFN